MKLATAAFCTRRRERLLRSPQGLCGERDVLRKLSPMASDCLRRAPDCEVKAENAADSEVKKNFSFLADQWRRLADSCEYLERSQSFLGR
jgi:hypothetical protein